jgi:hypothetical protein
LNPPAFRSGIMKRRLAWAQREPLMPLS